MQTKEQPSKVESNPQKEPKKPKLDLGPQCLTAIELLSRVYPIRAYLTKK